MSVRLDVDEATTAVELSKFALRGRDYERPLRSRNRLSHLPKCFTCTADLQAAEWLASKRRKPNDL